jgi:hypothetical protein
MSKDKTFKRGDLVEVMRETWSDWGPATYRAPSTGFASPHHKVDLDKPYYIDSMSGVEVTGPDPHSNPRAYLTSAKCVPSRRIRARSAP